jgi:hypothetical protein
MKMQNEGAVRLWIKSSRQTQGALSGGIKSLPTGLPGSPAGYRD